tara:strand:- start:250 stop:810 length:561 start_codon:yes stop_codon:yes gene_type:complete
MASIYDSTNWSAGSGTNSAPYTSWVIGQIVLHGEKYYYCTQAHTNVSGGIRTPVADSDYWGGYKSVNIGGVNKPVPHFYWVPSYAPSISSDPKVRSIRFGDGYEQRTPEGINNNLLSISLSFDNRKETEVTEMAHFLHIRKAYEAFAFLPPKPYSTMKRFVCRKWDVSVEFEGTYSLKATFEEVAE